MNQLLFCLATAVTVSIATGCGGGAAAHKEARMPVATSTALPGVAGGEAIVTTGLDESGPTRTVPTSTDAAPAEAQMAQAQAPSQQAATPVIPERQVVEGAVDLVAEDPEKTARGLHEEVEGLGGRVVTEQVDGASTSWRATIRVRLPPAKVDAVVAWLDDQGDISSKRIQATDVSRTLFDQEIALGNLTVTLERLRKLLDAGGLSMQDILNVEKEMTRLRGEIERIKGDKRFLEDRVALATLDITVSRREGALMSPRTKVYPGPRLAALTLFDAGDRKRTRLGGGFVMHILEPRYSLEIDVFDDVAADGDEPAEKNAVLATWGMGMYSDFLGRGHRRFLNPYLGFRIGYGYLGYHAFAVQGQAGIELFKHKYMMVDVDVRATGLFGEEVDAGLVTGGSIVFAF
ncbi:MAG TPA: DUF4349 domain-containing protein [Kofleriaceae bacterium]|nr:DUF4349 domain-containing protein [Kofleriaceae bacterium]